MIYSPGAMQLLLINARASGDGDTKLPLWPPEKFMRLVVAVTLGLDSLLTSGSRWCQGRPGTGPLTLAPTVCLTFPASALARKV